MLSLVPCSPTPTSEDLRRALGLLIDAVRTGAFQEAERRLDDVRRMAEPVMLSMPEEERARLAAEILDQVGRARSIAIAARAGLSGEICQLRDTGTYVRTVSRARWSVEG